MLSIWRKELVHGHGLKANERVSPRNQSRLLDILTQIPKDGSWDLHAEVAPEWKHEKAKFERRRVNTLDMRREVATLMRERQVPIPKNFSLSPSCKSQLATEAGLVVIQKFLVPGDRSLGTFQIWSQNRNNFPYFTQFVDNFVYQEVLAMTIQNIEVDRNAQIDLDILTHLLRSDIVVTNEKGFMKRAFDDLWRPKGKVLFTSADFAAHLQQM
jgi:Cft2 family RNA processing exonuclease